MSEEAREYNADTSYKIKEELPDGIRQIDQWREEGHLVALACGAFDLATPKHIGYLEKIRTMIGFDGKLVVAVDEDDYMRNRSTPKDPILTWKQRARIVAGYGCVDLVLQKDANEPEWLGGLRPNLVVFSATSFSGMRQRIDELLPYLRSIKASILLLNENAEVIGRIIKPDDTEDIVASLLDEFERQSILFESHKSELGQVSGTNLKREIIRRENERRTRESNQTRE